MSNFKKGDKVVCINENYGLFCAFVKHYYPNGVPNTVDTYTVRGLSSHGGIYLEEIVNPPNKECVGDAEPDFKSFNFRKSDNNFGEEVLSDILIKAKEEYKELELAK